VVVVPHGRIVPFFANVPQQVVVVQPQVAPQQQQQQLALRQAQQNKFNNNCSLLRTYFFADLREKILGFHQLDTRINIFSTLNQLSRIILLVESLNFIVGNLKL